MTNIQSKFLQPINLTCKDYHHPWTDKCVNATAGLLLSATPYCLRVYTVVYALSLLMRHRIPTFEDLKRTIHGILQSTAFLVTNAYTFIMYNCIIRYIWGSYNGAIASFVPCFFSSLTAILVERPARRPLLTLYVANVATETLWNMAVSRGLVRSIPQGQTLVFGLSISILLYLYRLGMHKTSCKDSIFNILRIFVGETEEGPKKIPNENNDPNMNIRRSRPPLNFTSITGLLQAYERFVDAVKFKHVSCLHKEPCIHYATLGGLKPFVGGIGLQLALKILLNVKKIVQGRMQWRKTIFDQSTLKLGIFLGGFSFLYKSVSCVLRHSFGCDDPRFAIPAGLIGSIAFTQYPDVTVALYVMWEMLQIMYNLGVQQGLLPRVPGFGVILYSFCTAVLFHAGILEPKALRPSYFKFLQAISGDRLTKFNLKPFDDLGLPITPHNATREVMQNLNIVNKTPLPKFAFAS